MPLNKGLRDEENERISNILKRLLGLDYVPDIENAEAEILLDELGIKTELLLNNSAGDILSHLRSLDFDWTNSEYFADLLVCLSVQQPGKRRDFLEKAIAVYNYIQSESKTFSFALFNKIASAKNNL